MNRALAVCALGALTACRPAAQAPAPAPTPTAPAIAAPDSIAVERWGNMGGGRSEWVIEASGAVRMVWDEAGDARTHRQGFTAGPAAFAEIRAMLAKLEARQGKGLENSYCATDSPGSAITWHYGKRKVELLVDNTCSDAESDAGVAQLDAIDVRLAALAKAAPDLKQTAGRP